MLRTPTDVRPKTLVEALRGRWANPNNPNEMSTNVPAHEVKQWGGLNRQIFPNSSAAMGERMGAPVIGGGGEGNKIGFLDAFLKAAAGMMKGNRTVPYTQKRDSISTGGPVYSSTPGQSAGGINPAAAPQKMQYGSSKGGGRRYGGQKSIAGADSFNSQIPGPRELDFASISPEQDRYGQFYDAMKRQASMKPMIEAQQSPYQAPAGFKVTEAGSVPMDTNVAGPSGGIAETTGAAPPPEIINPETGMMEANPAYLEYMAGKKKPAIDYEEEAIGGE